MADDENLALVKSFVKQVLKQGHVEVIDELTTTVEDGIDWQALREYFVSLEEYPGLRYRVDRLRTSEDGVTGTLHISAPVAFLIDQGKIVDLELPEYFMPEPPSPPPPTIQDPEPRNSVHFEIRLRELRDAIGELGVQLSEAVERFAQAKRDLRTRKDEQIQLRERSDAAAATGDESGATALRSRAYSLETVIAESDKQLDSLAMLIDQLMKYRGKADAALLQFELRAQSLEIRLRLSEVQRSIAAGVDMLGSVDDSISNMAQRLTLAEAEASEQLEWAKNAYEQRIEYLKSTAPQSRGGVEDRLRGLQEEISARAAATRAAAGTSPSYTLEELLAGITNENVHQEIDMGRPEGREVW